MGRLHNCARCYNRALLGYDDHASEGELREQVNLPDRDREGVRELWALDWPL